MFQPSVILHMNKNLCEWCVCISLRKASGMCNATTGTLNMSVVYGLHTVLRQDRVWTCRSCSCRVSNGTHSSSSFALLPCPVFWSLHCYLYVLYVSAARLWILQHHRCVHWQSMSTLFKLGEALGSSQDMSAMQAAVCLRQRIRKLPSTN